MQGDDIVFFLACVLLVPGSIAAVAARLGWLTDEEKKGILDKVFAPMGAVLIVGGAYELVSVVDAGRADFLDARSHGRNVFSASGGSVGAPGVLAAAASPRPYPHEI